MKKISLAIAVLLGSYQWSTAQIKKGSQNLGIDLTYENAKDIETVPPSAFSGTTKTSSVTIAPSYGYFISDGTELGGSIYYTNAKREYNASTGFADKSTSNTYGASVYLNKYVLFNNVVGFRVGPFLNYSWGTSVSSINMDPDQKNNDKYFSAGAKLDVVLYPAQNLGLALQLFNMNYAHQTSKGSATTQIDAKLYSARLFTNFTTVSLFYVLGKK